MDMWGEGKGRKKNLWQSWRMLNWKRTKDDEMGSKRFLRYSWKDCRILHEAGWDGSIPADIRSWTWLNSAKLMWMRCRSLYFIENSRNIFFNGVKQACKFSDSFTGQALVLMLSDMPLLRCLLFGFLAKVMCEELVFSPVLLWRIALWLYYLNLPLLFKRTDSRDRLQNEPIMTETKESEGNIYWIVSALSNGTWVD